MVVATFAGAQIPVYAGVFTLRARVRIEVGPLEGNRELLPSIAHILAASSDVRSTFTDIADACPDAMLHSGTHLLPSSFRYADLLPDYTLFGIDNVGPRPRRLDNYIRHGSISHIRDRRLKALPCLAYHPHDDIAALQAGLLLSPNAGVISLLVEHEQLPPCNNDMLLVLAPPPPRLVPQPSPPPPSPSPPLIVQHPPPRLPSTASQPPLDNISAPTASPHQSSLRAALLGQYPDLFEDMEFFLECAKGSRGRPKDQDRRRLGSAYAAYRALSAVETAAISMGLSLSPPSALRNVIVHDQRLTFNLYDLALALGLAKGTFQNYRTKVGGLSKTLQLIRSGGPETQELADRLELFMYGPESDNAVFTLWAEAEFVRDLRPWRQRPN